VREHRVKVNSFDARLESIKDFRAANIARIGFLANAPRRDWQEDTSKEAWRHWTTEGDLIVDPGWQHRPAGLEFETPGSPATSLTKVVYAGALTSITGL
jgi:hypothetical protein